MHGIGMIISGRLLWVGYVKKLAYGKQGTKRWREGGGVGAVDYTHAKKEKGQGVLMKQLVGIGQN